ncbi:MAG: EVE domain-containing protein [Parvularculaceae bacterium]|nr:EVE domain-containing protein [Parvularculaceae bacterium]
MAYWLLKSEPKEFSWSDQVRRGAKGEAWSGVRNAQARINLRAMKKGDLGFFYHTGDEKRVVGVVKVIREAYPDPKAPDWTLVDVAAVEPLARPVALAEIRKEPKLAEMALVKNTRLSVQKLTDAEWKVVRQMGGMRE